MFQFDITIENQVVVAVTSGGITLEATRDLRNAVLLAAEENSFERILIDHRSLDAIPSDLDYASSLVDAMVEFFTEVDRNIYIAVVVNKDGFGAGVLIEKMFSSDGVELKAFTNMDNAKQWLGI